MDRGPEIPTGVPSVDVAYHQNNRPTGDTPRRSNVSRRVASLVRFREKRKERCFEKKIRYTCRKEVALRVVQTATGRKAGLYPVKQSYKEGLSRLQVGIPHGAPSRMIALSPETGLDDMNIEIMRNTLYKAYLEDFYSHPPYGHEEPAVCEDIDQILWDLFFLGYEDVGLTFFKCNALFCLEGFSPIFFALFSSYHVNWLRLGDFAEGLQDSSWMFAVPGEMKAQGELFDSLLPGRWGAMRTKIWALSPVDRVETMGDECLFPGLSLLEALDDLIGSYLSYLDINIQE
ncbi:hypothetical protein IFM89_000966 [Coptis chinensis]|uniref:CCT domain-containing protein n=1 Tax=Coptis chinensis TaxID=261450 RepID=A0A835IIC6_9MAGN|nr:hypothetical protein IFM89_000966 [Coptis chinensis]